MEDYRDVDNNAYSDNIWNPRFIFLEQLHKRLTQNLHNFK